MKTNKILMLVLAGAGLFGLLALLSMNRGGGDASAENTSDMVIAKVEIPLGSVLNPDQVELVRVPKTALPEMSFSKAEDLIGRVSINAIGPREPLTEYRLAPKGSLAGLAALVPEGYRAMAVKVDDEAGVAGLLSPGMLVDVISVVRQDGGGRNGTEAKVVLQNIKVLATGQNMATPKEQVTPESVKSVTLLVTPAEAEKLVMASHETRLRLIVRNQTDNNSVTTSGINPSRLLNGDPVQELPKPSNQEVMPTAAAPNYAPAPRARKVRTEAATAPVAPPQAAPAAPAAPKVNTVEVYQGGKRTEVAFPNQ